MPTIVEAIFNNLSLFISILGALSLGLGFQIFKGITEEENSKTNLLEFLVSRQIEKFLKLIDEEIGRYELSGSPEAVVNLDPIRRRNVCNLLDELWEDALEARKFENAWNNWSRWEHFGRITCTAGFFLNTLFLIVVVFGVPTVLPNKILWLALSAIGFGGPIVFALICWIVFTIYKSRVLSVLEAPIQGAPRRKFGDV
jgi:hypothetical protein